ncbi:DUF1615 domain-containing protein [Thiocystis violacea]|uniref:DUF1615 domain-containing protein n=1 Tax=Thiocystis violacea TaxID=13725 RepID=UPI00190867A2|nr:DUF1615 domain-containing protein [Thiocystis violacea]MBK1719124.1 hypothetical protein [Thiocystis violacea]
MAVGTKVKAWSRLVGLLLMGSVLAMLVGCASKPVTSSKGADTPARPPEPLTRAPRSASKPSAPAIPKSPRARALALANKLLPPDLRDRDGWARDIATSLVALSIPSEPHKICAVAAIIEQESGWQADPVVHDLPGIARREMDKKLDRYMIPGAVLDVALRKESANGKTYAERIAGLRTERELSLLYEEMIAELPQGERFLGGMNPVRTGGPMQVSVGFAAQVMRERPYPWRKAGSAREEVFTRRGGVYFGTAMLLDYPVSYDRMIYRFADFNAGRYASRNAAFQRLAAALSGHELAPDGDLLRYKDGQPVGGSQTQAALEDIPALGLGRAAIKRDLLLEKSFDFERTELYGRVRDLARQRGLAVPVAAVPDIALKSPKITRKLTTRWFAERVEGRYRRCLARDTPEAI